MDFLRKDLVHLFDEQGIDKDSYEEVVEFIDPITRYNKLSGVQQVTDFAHGTAAREKFKCLNGSRVHQFYAALSTN